VVIVQRQFSQATGESSSKTDTVVYRLIKRFLRALQHMCGERERLQACELFQRREWLVPQMVKDHEGIENSVVFWADE
jgi:hypothetical protein